MAKIDLHDRSDHLIEERLREACFLQVFTESLVEQSDIVIPSNGVHQLFYATEGIVMGLVTIDPHELVEQVFYPHVHSQGLKSIAPHQLNHVDYKPAALLKHQRLPIVHSHQAT